MRIVEAKKEDRDIMMNLLEKYLYEFSQWEKTDVNDNGLYGYEYLDCYFEENNRCLYFIKVDEKIAGLILISDYPEVPEESTDFCLSEFFIMHKYRSRPGLNTVINFISKSKKEKYIMTPLSFATAICFWITAL